MKNKAEWLNRFIVASFWASSTSYLFFTINFLGQIFLARILAPEDFGIYAFTLAIREIVLIFLGFLNNQTFMQSKGEQADFNAIFLITCLASLLVLCVACVGSAGFYFIYNAHYAWMFFIICLSQIFTFFGTTQLAPLEKSLRYKEFSLAQGSASTLSLLTAIFLAWIGFGVWSLAAREVLQGLVLLLMALFWSKMFYRFQVKHEGLYQQLKFGMSTAISRGLEVLYYRFPDVLIQIFLGKVALGNFFQARYLSYLPIKLTTPFSEQVLFAYLSEIKTDKEHFRWHLYWINYVISRLLLPVALVVLFFGTDIFKLIYGVKWISAGEYFRYFSPFILFAALFSGLQSGCYSLHKQRYVTQAYLVALIVFILSITTFAHGELSALAFSFGMLFAYLYLLLRLWWQDVKLPMKRLWMKPLLYTFFVCIAYEWITIQDLFLVRFAILTILFYWLERKEWMLLLQRIKNR